MVPYLLLLLLIAAGAGVYMTTRNRASGLEVNNPLNIRATGVDWQNEITPAGAEFEHFGTLEAGVRAGARNLKTYYQTHGLRSIAAIISRWAPEHENPTGNYIQYVAERVGVDPDHEMNVSEFGALLPDIVAAMARFETGQEIELAAVRDGVRRA